jgi:phosphohistidine phosphatase SixA
MIRSCLALCLFLLCLAPGRAAKAEMAPETLWASIRSGEAFIMLRHAIAPGTGDPDGFRLDDCDTQRNLSEEGRVQARAIGATFRANGLQEAELRSSAWCRCLETARLLEIGSVEPLAPLNSFFDDRASGPAQTQALQEWLSRRTDRRPLVLVTHQVNITALTGFTPRSGEAVVARTAKDGSVEKLGVLPPPDA